MASSAEERLKKFLYLSTEQPHYVCGNQEFHDSYSADKLIAISELLQGQRIDSICQIIEEVNDDNVLVTRIPLFCALSIAISKTTTPAFKHKLFCTLDKVLRTNEDLCCFIKFYTIQKKKFGTALNRIISNYYLKKDPYDFAVEATNLASYHSWTLKDVLKLSHIKSSNVCTDIVLSYVLFGRNQATKLAEGKPETELIMQRFLKVDELKRCEDEKRIIELIAELQCNCKRVPSFYHKSLPVWEALLPHVPLNELPSLLPRFFKLEFLKSNSSFQKKVVDLLSNTDNIKASKIHPVEVFIAMKNFEKGGKPIHPAYIEHQINEAASDETKEEVKIEREQPKCSGIVSALHKMMQISFKNKTPTGKSILFAFESSNRMERHCVNNKNVNCLEATVILILSYLRVESDITVAAFNDTKLTPVSLDKNITFNQAFTRLKQVNQSAVLLTTPFEWTITKRKQTKVFIYCLNKYQIPQMSDNTKKHKVIEAFNKYKTKMNVRNSKLILLSLSAIRTEVYVEPNVLTISGFSKDVPKIIDAFINDLFV